MTINNNSLNDIQIIEERLQDFLETLEGKIIKEALDEIKKTIVEQDEKITELEKELKSSNSKEKLLEELSEIFGDAIKNGKFVGSTEPAKPKEYSLTDSIDESKLKEIVESLKEK